MNTKITELLDQISNLESELKQELHKREARIRVTVEGKKIHFESAIAEAHAKLKVAIIPWLLSSRLRNTLSAPFIYAMIIPLALLDLCMSLYQHICFRLYGVPRIDRSSYVVVDRHQLGYLNAIEKLNCVYCGYGNGVIAFTREVIARTEQYWCPIKHARKVLGTHRRYQDFLAYGDAENYPAQVLRFRDQLRNADVDKS